MARALVIRNADFSENRVAIITFTDIFCTGISFDSSTITVTGYNPVTVGYTVTPSNTTEIVVWESSDDSVVSVNNGVLTINGIGTATITATCGMYSANATVTVDIAYIPNYAKAIITYVSAYNSATIKADSYRIVALGSGVQAADYPFVKANSYPTDSYPILLPNNTKAIKVSMTDPTVLYNSNNTYILFCKNESCGHYQYTNCIKATGDNYDVNLRTDGEYSVNVPSGADAVVICQRFIQEITEETDPIELMTDAGFKLEFLTTAVSS